MSATKQGVPSSGPARREASRATDAPGHRRRVTIGDVADRAGVSKSLVSFVFNDRPGVSVATRERILQAAKDLGWQPSARARALSRNKTQAVGLVIRREPELLSTDPFFPQFLAGVETGLAQHDYALVLQVVGDPATERAAYERFARESRVDGVFLTDVRVADDRHQLVASLGLSSVVIAPTSASPGTDAAVVGMDDATGVRRAVHHLHALGHRRIGHVMGAAGYVHTEARKQAWTNTLDELGIRDRAIATADFTGGSGTRATHELLDLPRPPSAIIYGNDLMAIAGISAATDRGIRVPEDLSVVGFDDIPLAPYIVPPLTTIRQDVVAWGAAAAETLVAAVEGRERPALSLPPVDFVVRGSTGRARSQPKR